MDEEHLNKAKGGWGHNTGINLSYYILSTYTGEKFGFKNVVNMTMLVSFSVTHKLVTTD